MSVLLSPKLWAAVFVAVLLAVIGVQTARVANAQRELAEERQERAEESVERERIARRSSERAREIEAERRAAADRIERNKDAQIETLTARANVLAGELRNRPARPAAGRSAAARDPAPQAACTGAGLYRDDGQFLVWFAAAAARVAAERDACHDRYESLQAPEQ